MTLDNDILIAHRANLVSFPTAVQATNTACTHRNKDASRVSTMGAVEVDINHCAFIVSGNNFPIGRSCSLAISLSSLESELADIAVDGLEISIFGCLE